MMCMYMTYFLVFTARRNDSAVYAMAIIPCPSVSVTSRRFIETDDESSCFWHGSFIPPILHGVIWKFWYLQK